jgi:hypothetical protein
MKKVLVIAVIALSLQVAYAQRGCFSWHGGEASCDQYGRIVCNDGKTSPTCRCDSDSVSEKLTTKAEAKIIDSENQPVKE